MRIAAVVLGLMALGCQSATSPTAIDTWGGREASLVLTASGGTVLYPCGTSIIDSTWSLDAAGQFRATGQYFSEAGPTRYPPHPARYSGQVQGDSFTLVLTLTDLNQTLGPFHLVRGGPPLVNRCA